MIHILIKDIRYRWFEYLLCSVIVAMAIMALIFQYSVTSSAGNKIHDLAHKLGRNMLVVSADTDPFDYYEQKYNSTGMPDTYPQKIKSSDLARHVRSIQPQLLGNIQINNFPFIVVGGDAKPSKIYQRPDRSKTFTVGKMAAKVLNISVGDSIDINGNQFRLSQINNFVPEGFELALFTSLGGAQKILKQPGRINAMHLSGCWCRINVVDLGVKVEKLLPGTKAITITGMMKAQTGIVKVMKEYSVLIYVLAISLIIFIIAMLIISQVRRQIREIGVLLAIGSSPWFLMRLFMFKAVLVSLVGCFLGYVFGVPIIEYYASTYINLSLKTPPQILLPLFLGCVLVGAVASIFPSLYASNLDPTEILREK